MEAPCVCECGNLFDLNDGYKSLHSNIVICENCHESEEKGARIEELEETIYNLEKEIEFTEGQIEDLGYKIIAWKREINDAKEELKQLQNES